jgi:two-component system KDP operon response regulator KdpE
VVDDDPGVRRLLQDALVVHEFEVETADSGTEAVEQASTVKPDLVLLDLGLPDVYGLELLEHLREMAAAPIMVLSAHHDEGTKVAALELGAQDYVTKPFGLAELVARIRVRLRLRAGAGHGDAIFRVKDLAVDLQRRRVHVAGREARLTAKEFDLLKALIHADGQVLTVQQLLHQV